MNEYLTTTTSTCRGCRRLIPARVHLQADGVWFHKDCPEHGPQSARVHGNAEAYRHLGQYHRPGSVPLSFAASALGCPASCGLCPEHEQHVCLPILEITDHCNLECPVCLVANRASFHWTREDTARVLDGLIRSEGHLDVVNLSGGEPTVSPHFRAIIEECLARKEILRVSVSTNGLRLAQDQDLLQFLAKRRVIISLQYDGPSDEVYRSLRGRPLAETKHRLIEACRQLEALMSLTVTVVKGVNEQYLPEISRLLFTQPHILSVMFQPAAYAGTAARLGRPSNAITIPDIVKGLTTGSGMVFPADFSPLPCGHPACFALAFYLRIEGDRFQAIKPMMNEARFLNLIQNRALFGTDAENFQELTDAVNDLWAGSDTFLPRLAPASQSESCAPGTACACHQFPSETILKSIRKLLLTATTNGYSPRKAMDLGERSVKSIFIHQFMDRDTFDLSRARKCCQVYPQLDGRLIPVCVHNCLRRSA